MGAAGLLSSCVGGQTGFVGTVQTKYAAFNIDDKGFITSIVDDKSKKEYSPQGHPSPLMSLYENDKLLSPLLASYDSDKEIINLRVCRGVI